MPSAEALKAARLLTPKRTYGPEQPPEDLMMRQHEVMRVAELIDAEFAGVIQERDRLRQDNEALKAELNYLDELHHPDLPEPWA